ncbi:putative vacuolar sorting-associated protein [Fimicolochytrium jonesii]|uniref:putative vacuolar sorting-associated protein n=1 Tax=Fimicolochytrium jonesii TaxID=1396493 RepID=UPI0022FE4F89|nr:putative vacuolar sorting-associated protein [Fimicolochytrium jonesii]KAI8816735.1 putative vacuolar sorting-associated protein [Fimicolochytrium jonesii]
MSATTILLMSFLFANPLDDIVDKATSENLPIGTEDLVLNLDIADKIKAKEVTPKQAAQSLKRRINHKNPNVQLLALKLTDTCVKNSGHHFVQEVASREFIDNLVSIARAPSGTNSDVRQKILASIQSWGLAFKSKSELRYVSEVYDSLKRDGITFPPIEKSESSAMMIETTTAPEWTDSDVCMRCRSQFTTFNRKHHCRNCGQTFCGQCSSKTMALPRLGIVQEVRVCDTCHSKLTSKSPPGTPLQSRKPEPRSAGGYASNDLARKEEEDLQKALELSLKASKPANHVKPPVQRSISKPKPREEEDDEDLKAAIAASLQDAQGSASTDYSGGSRPEYEYKSPGGAANATSAAPNHYPSSQAQDYGSQGPNAGRQPAPLSASSYNPNELSSVELENIRLFSELVERTEADVGVHGLGVLNNSQIQTLYAQIATMQPKLARSLDETSRKYAEFYDLHEQLSGAVREYDRLLSERLNAAGYLTKPYAGGATQPPPGSHYLPQQQPHVYHAPAGYSTPPASTAQAAGYYVGNAPGEAPHLYAPQQPPQAAYDYQQPPPQASPEHQPYAGYQDPAAAQQQYYGALAGVAPAPQEQQQPPYQGGPGPENAHHPPASQDQQGYALAPGQPPNQQYVPQQQPPQPYQVPLQPYVQQQPLAQQSPPQNTGYAPGYVQQQAVPVSQPEPPAPQPEAPLIEL